MNFISRCSFSYLKTILIFVLLPFIFWSCKSVKKQSKQEKEVAYSFFQNVTSKYNILHNANLMLDAEINNIANASSRNFQIRQSVFDEPVSQGEPHKLMDSLITKVYKVINDKQESKYVHEAYLLIGEANYLKGSYYTAIEFFNQLVREQNNPTNYLPVAYAWKSRALLQINKIEPAKAVLDSALLSLTEEDSKKVFALVNASFANYFVRTGHFEKAITYLEKAQKLTRKSSDKVRWTFLLAQLYQETGQTEQALKSYRRISKSNVPFEMAFEASLQVAFLRGQAFDDIAQKVKPLKRMLREGKNDGFQDQILYQIGNIYYQNGRQEEALSFFARSLREPKRNNYQATETYLHVGDHYFGKGKYLEAQRHYDSVAMVLPADFTDVNKLRRRLGYMNEITALYQDVSWQDTLLHLASLDENDRNKLLDAYAVKELIDKKAAIAQASRLEKAAKQTRSSPVNAGYAFSTTNQYQEGGGASATDRTFYFNNPDELLLGQAAFKRRWGNRQLKDNWRFEAEGAGASRPGQLMTQSLQAVAEEKEKEVILDEEAFLNTAKSRYSMAIPATQEALDASHKKVHDNLIVIGNIYREYVKNKEEAIRVYTDFLKRYPDSAAAAEVYYALYRMYSDTDRSQADFYKQQLIALYPNSIHALVALDPGYLDRMKKEKSVLDGLFEKLYTSYLQGDYSNVIAGVTQDLETEYRHNALLSQLEYLKALAIGRTADVMQFSQALTQLVDRFPTDSLVTPLAKENLQYIAHNPDLFAGREFALEGGNQDRLAFVDEPNMTPWPALYIEGDYRTSIALSSDKPKILENKKETAAVQQDLLVANTTKEDIKKEEENTKFVAEKAMQETIVEKEEAVEEKELRIGATVSASQKEVVVGTGLNANLDLDLKGSTQGITKMVHLDNDYRDKELLPDSAEYYFIINVMSARTNVAPSRYGIGQFNRTRYQRAGIAHQLKVVNEENQLILVGPFNSFEEVKSYESRILPLMPEIMKVPVELYNSFIVRNELIPTLSDGLKIKDYYKVYTEQ